MTNISNDQSPSIQVPARVVKKFIAHPGFPYLISFPRTGSHWLRMIMELYFEKPSLVRIFYYKDAKDFTCYHRHDEDLSIRRQNVIYLYRHPVATIYSQLNYYKEDIEDRERIMYWAGLYGRHLAKWLLQEDFTTRKTIVTYEGMKQDMASRFQKICDHFSVPLDREKLQAALAKVNKNEVKDKTPHDPQVIDLTDVYRRNRETFKDKYGEVIMDCIYAVSRELNPFIMMNQSREKGEKDALGGME